MTASGYEYRKIPKFCSGFATERMHRLLYHRDAHMAIMRNNDRAAWDGAVEVDQAIRTGLRGIRGEVFPASLRRFPR
ncbi:hypothetical protein [Mesorhizobium sp. M1339]|uniref:hypothetical protein n=2 Tax=unclassified Mesorhizobium TaxID=325217 RepID=UPI0033394D77